MNYQTIGLDKTMYRHEKGFAGYLEELDPSAAYAGTPLAGLDAFERQLNRFGIRVKGAASSAVGKFFATTDSAALFPEYVARAVAQGAKDGSILEEIIASRTEVNSLDYRSITTDLEDDDLSDPIGEGEEIPKTKIDLSDSLVKLKKRGRLLQASYEALKFQRVDVVSVALAQIGAYIAKAHLKDAVAILEGDAAQPATVPQSVTVVGSKVAYEDLLALWGAFDRFDMNVILAAPDMMLEILAVPELKDPVTGMGFQNSGGVMTPLGAKLIKCSAVTPGTAIAIDRRFALEQVQAGGIQVEYDKLIDTQLERAAVTSTCGFNKLFPGAVKVLEK